jgi:short-subunit dehydrogenase
MPLSDKNGPPAAKRRLGRFGPAALVTGASDGIGRAFAELLASEGFDLVLVARRSQALHVLAADLSERHGVTVEDLALDLAQPDAASHIASATEGFDIGLLVAAAGFGSCGEFLSQPRDDEIGMVDVNCRVVADLCHRFGGRFAHRGSGGIVLFGSLVGWQGVPGSATYAATKAFIQSFAEGLHAELKPRGVDVLCCAPGPVRSGFAARAGMTMDMADQPGDVAREALSALGRRVTIVPGRTGRLLTWSLSPLPRSARTAILKRIMAGMAKDRVSAN